MTRSYTIPRNFRRVVRRILGHGTYSLCQLSYDVGQRVSIASQNRAWNGPRIFILYAKWKTALRSHKPGPVNPPIPREKLYENRSYLRACPRRQADGAVARRRRDHARSEEHTSELQSRLHLVCRLLLEKKKKKETNSSSITI